MNLAPRVGALLLAACIATGAIAHAQPLNDAAAQQADAHFKSGKALLQAGKKQEALAEYRAALALKRSYDVAGNLGSLELDLGFARDAAEHLAFALKNYAPSGTTPEQLEKARQRFATARAQVGAVTISVNVPGCEVLVDGKLIGRGPLSDDVFLDVGPHQVEVRATGYEPATRAVTAARGSSANLALELAPSAAPIGAPTTAPSGSSLPPTTTPSGPVPAILIAGGAATLVGAGMGVTFTVVANGKAGDADKLASQLKAQGGSTACASGSSQCTQLNNDRSSVATMSNAAFWTFIGAGAVGAATLIYWAATPKGPSSTTSAHLEPLVGPNAGGVAVRGSW